MLTFFEFIDDHITSNIQLVNEVSIEQINNTIKILINVAIDGIPNIVDSTYIRKLRYLEKNDNNTTLALEAAKYSLHAPLNKMTRIAISNIPFVGLPYSLVIPYWMRIRYLLLVAILYEHDLSSKDTFDNIISCLMYSSIKIVSQQSINSGSKSLLNAVYGSVTDITSIKIGSKIAGKLVGIPVNALLVYLEKEIDVIKCADIKFKIDK